MSFRNDEQWLRIKNEVTRVLDVLSEAGVKYAVWGTAALAHHGGRWLWSSPDHEILIEDCYEGPFIHKAVNRIAVKCSNSWQYDHDFNADAWSVARGDKPPRRPAHRLKHTSIPDLGVILVPSISTYKVSMQYDELVNGQADPVWVYPNLKSFAENLLRLWSYEGRNSARTELMNLAGANNLDDKWAEDVGLEMSKVARPGKMDLQSELEVWQGIMERPYSGGRLATSRFRARRAEKDAKEQLQRSAETGAADEATEENKQSSKDSQNQE